MSSKRKSSNGFICDECGKNFSSRRSLYEHMRNIHKTQPAVKKRMIFCPVCDEKFNYRQEVFSHLSSIHNTKVHFEKKEFNNLNEFIQWKEDMENETKTQYVLKRGVKTLADKSKRLYYHCCRSGDYEQDKIRKSLCKSPDGDNSKTEKKTRRPRSQGSRRIGKLCPATIEVTYNNDHATVLFWSTHIGHTNDLRYCSLSKLERNAIAAKLAEGKTFNHILNDIKSSTPEESDQLNRVHLITKKDLNNIRVQSAVNESKRLLIYVESESDLQNQMREKIEEVRRLCDSTVHEEETCRSVIEHLDSAMKMLEAGREASLISNMMEVSDDETVDKQRRIFSMRRKRALKRETTMQNKQTLRIDELPIILEVKKENVESHIEHDHYYL